MCVSVYNMHTVDISALIYVTHEIPITVEQIKINGIIIFFLIYYVVLFPVNTSSSY